MWLDRLASTCVSLFRWSTYLARHTSSLELEYDFCFCFFACVMIDTMATNKVYVTPLCFCFFAFPRLFTDQVRFKNHHNCILPPTPHYDISQESNTSSHYHDQCYCHLVGPFFVFTNVFYVFGGGVFVIIRSVAFGATL